MNFAEDLCQDGSGERVDGDDAASSTDQSCPQLMKFENQGIKGDAVAVYDGVAVCNQCDVSDTKNTGCQRSSDGTCRTPAPTQSWKQTVQINTVQQGYARLRVHEDGYRGKFEVHVMN